LRLLIFDFDGTLADTIPLCVAAIQHALRKNTGRELTRNEVVALFGISEEGILQKLAPECADECVRDFLQYYRENHAPHQLFPGIPELLEEARGRGIQLALVTGKGAGSAGVSAEALELSRYFEIIRTGNAERDIKEQNIRDICEELSIAPGETAYVGDAPSDMVSSKAAGVMAVAAAWSDTVPREELEAATPDLLFLSVADFHAWLMGPMGRM